jgi:hypothetical protein
MKNLKKIWVLFLGIIFIACDDTTDPVSITVTPPATYAFDRDGTTTVSYGGQSSRLEMAGELSVWLNTPTKTKTELVNMFDNGAGFGNPGLAASGKKLGNKTASSSQASSTVKPQFDAMIDDVTSNVFPAVNAATDASAGVAGVYTDAGDGGRTVKINGKGHEINQLFTKGLMGALVCDQIIWGYLTAGKLDAGTNKADNDAGTVVEGKNYTQMEHYWDEGFGYLYGLDTDISNSSIEGQDVLVSKYLKKVDGSSLPGIAQELYDAFKHGRAAIVAGAYDVRDEQAEIVKTKLSHIIGRKAADYLRSGAGKINDGKWADAHHALSEGWGFILSLQFTKNPTSGAPYYSNSEVNDMLTQIDNFWTVTPANLESMAAGIESKFGF